MRRITAVLPALLLLIACGTPEAPPAGGAGSAGEKQDRLTAEEIAASVTAAMDRSADPCKDFYRYACGGWLASTKLPSDKSYWGRGFSEIAERNLEVLREILEDAARDPGDDANRRLIGGFYAACMDESAAEKAGIAPLKPLLDEIASVGDAAGLMRVTARMHEVIPTSPFFPVSLPGFSFAVLPDFADPTLDIAHVGQAGIGLPDRDYYFPQDDSGKALLADYEKHVARMLGFLGIPEGEAAAGAKAIVALETALAEVSMKREDLRDFEKIYHKIDIAGLKGLTPGLPWEAYLEAIGQPSLAHVNVMTPEFFEGLDAVLAKADPKTLQTYLRWHLISSAAPRLTKEIVDANFEFFGKRLQGQKEIEARWKRCVQATDTALGEALGRAFVERQFAGDSKEKALEMIHDVEAAFEASLPDLAWMDAATRGRAVGKKAAVYNKIGYPDRWRDYSGLEVKPGAFHENAAAAARFDFQRNARKVGGKADKGEWFMSPPTVNAYYNPLFNEMVFPAGIMQRPFFHRDFPAAMNYGGMGMVMGHELTHGFDDQGRKFDKLGRLTPWWEPAAVERFEGAAACVRDAYDGREVLPGARINGQLTLGENIADLGGIKEAYRGFKRWETRQGSAASAAGAAPSPVEGLTADQLFFVGFAQTWCTLMTEEIERLLVNVDSHSPPELRVNVPLAHFPTFAEAFQCAEGTPMNPAGKCVVW